MAQVLVALNLYIGRWRMQGMFATDGPTFIWGRFFVASAKSAAKRAIQEEVAHPRGDTPDDDDTSTLRSPITATDEIAA